MQTHEAHRRRQPLSPPVAAVQFYDNSHDYNELALHENYLILTLDPHIIAFNFSYLNM